MEVLINSLKIILNELEKLEKSKEFKGVYYDSRAFNKIKNDMLDCINTIKKQ